MSAYVLHVSDGMNGPDLPEAWVRGWEKADTSVLVAPTPLQAAHCAKGYPLLVAFLELADDLDAAAARLADLLAAPATRPFPVFVVARRPLAPAEEARLAEAGATGILATYGPADFALRIVEALRGRESLERLEASGMDVRALAEETRKLMHDMSQPLATIQGRIQIMQFRETDEAKKEKFAEVVAHVGKMTEKLMELQELHRKFS